MGSRKPVRGSKVEVKTMVQKGQVQAKLQQREKRTQNKQTQKNRTFLLRIYFFEKECEEYVLI